MTEPTKTQLAAEEKWRAAQADIPRHDAEVAERRAAELAAERRS